MLPVILISLALACALISRFLLFKAAFGTGVWWGLGLFVPFGPTVFRLNFPDESRNARRFGLATLAFAFFYVLSSSHLSTTNRFGFLKNAFPGHKKVAEIGSNIFDATKPVDKSMPKPAPTPTLQERRATNAQELADLRTKAEQLRLKKRDLLHSDVEGNHMYAIEVDSYNAALQKATTERAALASGK